MSDGAALQAAVQHEAVRYFHFLVSDLGYDGPELVGGSAVYIGTVRVSVGGSFSREPEVVTVLALPDATRRARLSVAYAEAGLGPAQAVPEGARTLRVAVKRLEAQATALRRLLTELDAPTLKATVVACHGR